MALPVRSMTLTEAVDTTRTGSAWYFNSDLEYVEESTSDVARIDYDPATGDRLGLMAEGASTNFATPSTTTDEVFNSTGLNRVSFDSTANNKSFGTNIPLRGLIPSTDNATHFISTSETGGTAGGTKTFSCYAIAGDNSNFEVWVFGTAGDRVEVRFNLTGAGSVAASSDSGTPVFESARIRLVGQSDQGDDVYRCEVTGNYPGSTSTAWAIFLTNSSGGTFFTGDGSTVRTYIGGIQFEELPGASSYIPTTTAQVTRAAETHELVSLDPWYRASGYSVAVQYRMRIGDSVGRPLAISDASGQNRVYVINNLGGNVTLAVETQNNFQADTISATPTGAHEVGKIAFRVAAGDSAASHDGSAAVASSQSGLPSAATQVGIGTQINSSGNLGVALQGWIQDVKYTTQLWTDAELEAESGDTV